MTHLLWESPDGNGLEGEVTHLKPVHSWLADYFQGCFRPLDFPLDPQGTPFQKKVWQRLLAIPPGCVETYGAVARSIGSSPRAVGQGVGRNPIPILIPCHRVVAAQGLGGFSAPGGTTTKKQLLRLEGWSVPDHSYAPICWQRSLDGTPA